MTSVDRDAVTDRSCVVGETTEHVPSGERFDPRAYTPPDLTRAAEGGYGLYLISQLVDGVSFEGTEHGGRVVLVKNRSAAGVRRGA